MFLKLTLSLLLWIGCYSPAYASLYAEAPNADYVIIRGGEKFLGRIINNNSGRLKTLKFEHLNVEEALFSHEDLEAYGYKDGKQYVKIDLPHTDQKAFLQVIFSGSFTLLHQRNTFYISNSDEVFELKKRFPEDKSNYVPPYKRPYTGLLKVLMAGNCGFELNDRITTTKLRSKSLIDILIRYHECEGLDCLVFKTWNRHVYSYLYYSINTSIKFS